MNFFEHQDRARSSTKLLVFLFACAVIALIFITTFIIIVSLDVASRDGSASMPGINFDLLSSDVFLLVATVVIGVVGLGVLYRMTQLRGGGSAVAESLGGRLLNLQTRDADERKVLNVVEEMAIAAGLPVPQVYLIDDAAINAFAAGYKPQDAVIGVTRGCVHELSRDELQGVIAHEFSHILNGDMRLNIRLIGWLYGIMVVGLIGYHLLRSMRYTGGGRNRKTGGGVVFLALGLLIVGYGGTFFGNLIKAAVSRQREFLADASAVQYTRNPDGISSALKKIGGYAGGTAIRVTDTTEISHMLFGQGSRSAFFATHPPLEERIRRIEPRWAELPADATPEPNQSIATSDNPRVQGFADSVGRPTAASLTEAQQRLDMLPADLREEVHNTLGACLTIFALVIAASEPQLRAAQWQYLQAQLTRPSQDRLTQLDAAVMTLDRKLHLPLIELAQPVLRQLSRAQQATFMEQLQQLIKTDAKITLFEWSLVRILGATLARPGDRAQKELLELEQCKDECVVLLAVLARTGRNTEDGASAAFSAGLSELQLKTPAHLLAMDAADLAALDKAMDRLRKLKPLQKPRLLKALMRCVRSDGIVTSSEAELLRAIGAVLDCPIPPLA